MSKTSKGKKAKSAQTTASAQQDVVGLITMLVGKLVSLEAKIDTILKVVSRQPAEVSRQQPPASPLPQNRIMRVMYKVVCADCGNACEVPFKPSADRPVYCKNCFTIRKQNNAFMPRREEEPKKEPAPRPAPAKGKKKRPAKKRNK